MDVWFFLLYKACHNHTADSKTRQGDNPAMVPVVRTFERVPRCGGRAG